MDRFPLQPNGDYASAGVRNACGPGWCAFFCTRASMLSLLTLERARVRADVRVHACTIIIRARESVMQARQLNTRAAVLDMLRAVCSARCTMTRYIRRVAAECELPAAVDRRDLIDDVVSTGAHDWAKCPYSCGRRGRYWGHTYAPTLACILWKMKVADK